MCPYVGGNLKRSLLNLPSWFDVFDGDGLSVAAETYRDPEMLQHLDCASAV